MLHATSAEEGLLLAAQQPLSLITLDIALPRMDGWDFLTRIKQVPSLRHVPVVIISILADFTKGFALGAAAVMQKPVTRKELYGSLAQLGLFAPAEGQVLTVLVVDDDPKAVELVAVRLTAIGASVLRANGGQEAIDLARAKLPGLIVLDLMMPTVNGFDVVEALRERPETARIPIIVMTAKRISAEDHAGSMAPSRRSWRRGSSIVRASPRRSGGRCRAANRCSEMATILIVEDNPTNMTLAVYVLESAGHVVLTATDAEAGLTLARSALPNLILMDIQLPGMDGLEATAHLKADVSTRAIPVIALTALAMKGDEERIRAAGCDGYIAKPMNYKDFLATVALQLGA